MPNLSVLNSTLPPFTSRTARATSKVTVPDFGFGIRPRGPRILPSGPTLDMMSGVATAASKSVQPSDTFLTRSSPPTKSAPASWASRCLSPVANTATRTFLPVPFGRTTDKKVRSEEHTSELQSLRHLVCRLLLEKKKEKKPRTLTMHAEL